MADIDIQYQSKLLREIKVDYFKSSGPGGQRKNKVETAVRMVHQPTGITVVARERRSRSLNFKLAMERMARRLESAASRPARRVPTAPSASSRRRTLERKKRRAAVKRMREKVKTDTLY